MRSLVDALLRRPPRICIWELTLACNLRCRHCGSRAGRAREDELDSEEALKLLGDLGDLGVRELVLSGGEPLLRPDWPEIAARARKLGLLVMIITNGTRLDGRTTERVRELGVHRVAISVDGLHGTHDYIRAREGLLELLIEAFDRCAAAGLLTTAVTELNRLNLPEIEELVDLLLAHRVETWQVQIGAPTGNMADNMELMLDPEDLPELMEQLVGLKRRVLGRMRIDFGDNCGYYGPHEREIRKGRPGFWTGCMAGVQVMGIESNGNVKGCLSLPCEAFVEGNIRQRSLAEIWSDPSAFAYTRQFVPEQLGGFCASCRHGLICRGGCSWMAYAASGKVGDNPFCEHRVRSLRGS